MYAQGSSGRRGRAKQARAPPQLQEFFHVSRRLEKPADLEQLLAGDVAGVVAISLGSEFHVEDPHLLAIGQKLGAQLLCLELGNSDSGDGVRLTCAGVLQLVQACPNLVKLRLESVTAVDNATFHAILEGLPHLESLAVSGHDRCPGKLKGTQALKPLIDGKAPGLKRLSILDQGVAWASLEKLMNKRGATMQIITGETDGCSMASQMVMQEMGLNWGDRMYSNY